MSRFLSSVFIAVMLCGCGRAGIDAADRAALAAWDDFGQRMTAQAAMVASVGGPLCDRFPEEKSYCRPLRDAAEAVGELEFAKLDLTDNATIEQLRRALRTLEQQAGRLEQYPKKYPQLATDADAAKDIERLKIAARETRAAAERYDAVVMNYNRALRTFPESVTNNMFLHLRSRGYLNTDQRARNTPTRRGD